MRYQSYLNTTQKIIGSYKGEEPLSGYLKKFFASNKKYGSKDRKYIAALCYSYFRLGKAATAGSVTENIIKGLFLSEISYKEIVLFFKPEWEALLERTQQEKTGHLGFDVKTIFPFKDKLSTTVDHTAFCDSFLRQPKLFLRIRPGKKNILVQKLQKAKIPLALIDEDCIALSNATKLNDIIETDKEAVIQDYNSQQVFNFAENFVFGKGPVTVWDCCAASGGKSILLFDKLKRNVELTVSDIRLSILLNLHQRFSKAGIKDYNYFIADLNTTSFTFPALTVKGVVAASGPHSYQLIICDAPCSGSGTWSRTPEQLFYFDPALIEDYAKLQQTITTNSIPYLQPGGLFFYITCSVFKKENEEVAQYIKETSGMQLLHMELLQGYDKKADSMFVAVFKK